LNYHPDSSAKANLNQREFILHKEIAAEQDIDYAPKHGWNQKQEEKLLL